MWSQSQIFKLHELRASSRNGCLLLQLLSHREISKKHTTYGYNFQYCNKYDVTCFPTMCMSILQTFAYSGKQQPEAESKLTKTEALLKETMRMNKRLKSQNKRLKRVRLISSIKVKPRKFELRFLEVLVS